MRCPDNYTYLFETLILNLKKLQREELSRLSTEIRQVLLEKLSQRGGHIGPNLGAVELTLALHYVFESPKDKMVFDVSHQSYIHKMLTGRKEAFLNPEKYSSVSGYSNPDESEHDFFNIGHTSASVSLACGLAKARDLKKGDDCVIAIIGDGSLSGGEAYEGLNNAAELGTNMIIVVRIYAREKNRGRKTVRRCWNCRRTRSGICLRDSSKRRKSGLRSLQYISPENV